MAAVALSSMLAKPLHGVLPSLEGEQCHALRLLGSAVYQLWRCTAAQRTWSRLEDMRNKECRKSRCSLACPLCWHQPCSIVGTKVVSLSPGKRLRACHYRVLIRTWKLGAKA